MRLSRANFVAGVFLCLLLCHYSVANAEGAGIKVIPTTIEKAANPGDVVTEELTITNISDEDKEYYLFKRNIKGVEEGGVPIFAEDDAEPTGYEMTDWINLQAEPIVIPAHGEVKFPLVITIPSNASPGSHFGGIFVSVEAPKLRQTGAGVGYEVATIISIRISGAIIDSAQIRSFSTDKLFYTTKNVKFLAKIENKGNILVRPRGPLSITSMFGGEPAVMTINDKQAGVFPGNARDFEFAWNEEGLGFGKYEAILALSYDGDNGQKTIDASLVFWVFPVKVIVPIIVVFLGIALGGYLFSKYYINQALMRAAGGRRIPAQRYRKQVGISRFAFVMVSLMAVVVLFLIVLLIFFA